jgi:hypothetical protein
LGGATWLACHHDAYPKHEDEMRNSEVLRHAHRMVAQEAPMIRFGNALLLIGMSASLCGCASRQMAIRADFQQPQLGEREVSPEPAIATRTMQPAAPADDITASIRTNAIRPWPKRGTPEWDQLQAEELAREQRIKEVMSSICRGC